MISSLRSLSVLFVIVGAGFVLGACSGEVSIGDETINASELEKQASVALTDKTGQAPASIICPSDLKAEVGESEVCELEDQQGGTYDMTITITSVDGDGNAKFNIQVGDLKTLKTGS